MTLSEARENFCRFDALAVKFPQNAAIQRARKAEYERWLQACRNHWGTALLEYVRRDSDDDRERWRNA